MIRPIHATCSLRSLFAAVFLASVAATQSAAQCTSSWAPFSDNKSLGIVHDMVNWDPDGPGPLPAELIIATDSPFVGPYTDNQPLGYLGRWNATIGQWEPLGGGVNYTVQALAVLPNGDLVVAGEFTKAGWLLPGGGIDVVYIARWDGTAWHAYNDPIFGLGIGWITTLEALPNGDVVAGGLFEKTAGGVTLRNVARWSQASQAWQAMDWGIQGWVMDLAVTTGGLVAAGNFGQVGVHASGDPKYARGVARWNGSSWVAMGPAPDYGLDGFAEGIALLTLPNGDLIVAGRFGHAGGVLAHGVARWDGTNWHDLDFGVGEAGPPLSPYVRAMALLPDGDVAVAGEFKKVGSAGIDACGVARWRPSTAHWSPIATNALYASAYNLLVHPSQGLIASGNQMSLTCQDGVAPIAYSVARLQSTCPATATSQPTACVGPAGPLTLTADALPWTSSTLKTTAHGFAPGVTAFALIGLSTVNVPLMALHPSGLPGCDLLVTPDIFLPMAPQGNGTASLTIPIPDTPTLAGLSFHHQFVQAEPGTSGLASLSSSNSLAFVIGVL